ncbi:MAG TPA: hypothetical protein VEF04_22350 [Blastocatellia bacterium]|nr:hypothetical protein [Blastocatellia bacterium]
MNLNSQILFALTVILFTQIYAGSFLFQGMTKQAAAFSFSNVSYFHRFTNQDQHEFTPAGQEDLNAWTDMITINLYRKVRDGEGLAATANAELENYKAHKALVTHVTHRKERVRS